VQPLFWSPGIITTSEEREGRVFLKGRSQLRHDFRPKKMRRSETLFFNMGGQTPSFPKRVWVNKGGLEECSPKKGELRKRTLEKGPMKGGEY